MTSEPVARTPGAKRAGPGELLFDRAQVNHLKGSPDCSSVEGGVEFFTCKDASHHRHGIKA